MELYRPTAFRISGYGGAALYLRSGVVATSRLTVDVGLLTPTDYVWFLKRRMTAGLAGNLAEFFFGCARDLRPESSIEAVHDPLCGLDVRVLSSTDSHVELQIDVRAGPERAGDVNFLTSRVALTQAAMDVRILESAVIQDPPAMPPMDW